jgi:MarR family transcriptional regulator, organic hydroperoxide resistance regulator
MIRALGLAVEPVRDAMARRRTTRLPPIDDRISFLMHRIEAQLAAVCNPHFRHLDVVLHNSRMLVILLENGQARVAELVNRMVLPQSTISHQLRELEKRDLITRTTDRTDSRSTIVQLTPKGRRGANECNALSSEIYEVMVEGLSRADLARLLTQLRDIHERLRKFGMRKKSERLARRAAEQDQPRRYRVAARTAVANRT